ncbi:MAG: crossover junction endodeoxyribonuclease RuvC [Bacteroidia bacterium]
MQKVSTPIPSGEKIILGIDPGTNIMGFGLIQTRGNYFELIELGVLNMGVTGEHALKLSKIFTEMIRLIDRYHPDELAIEAPFYGKNVQSMLKLGRAQGVAIAAALSRQIPITEYAPKRIKQAITGNGNASKEQVAAMLDTLLKTELSSHKLDATDALAAAVCHHFQTNGKKIPTAKGGWKSFLRNNPDKLIG